MMHIEIETMLFGDYRVQVWEGSGESYSSALDREYFCRGFDSALMTALNIRTLPNFEKLDIYHREMNELKLINKFEEKND